jgi:hypothetical protein
MIDGYGSYAGPSILYTHFAHTVEDAIRARIYFPFGDTLAAYYGDSGNSFEDIGGDEMPPYMCTYVE